MNPLGVSILAGGKSSRMGQDKGLMLWHGKPMIQYVIDAVLPITHHIHIIANDPAYARLGWPVTADQFPDTGPAGGIATALLHSNCSVNLVLSCDIPRMDTGTLQFILQQHGPEAITVPEVAGKLHPTAAVYEHRMLHQWLMLMQQGERSLQKMIQQLPHKTADMHLYSFFHESAFDNMNSPDDLQNASQ